MLEDNASTRQTIAVGRKKHGKIYTPGVLGWCHRRRPIDKVVSLHDRWPHNLRLPFAYFCWNDGWITHSQSSQKFTENQIPSWWFSIYRKKNKGLNDPPVGDGGFTSEWLCRYAPRFPRRAGPTRHQTRSNCLTSGFHAQFWVVISKKT